MKEHSRGQRETVAKSDDGIVLSQCTVARAVREIESRSASILGVSATSGCPTMQAFSVARFASKEREGKMVEGWTEVYAELLDNSYHDPPSIGTHHSC